MNLSTIHLTKPCMVASCIAHVTSAAVPRITGMCTWHGMYHTPLHHQMVKHGGCSCSRYLTHRGVMLIRVKPLYQPLSGQVLQGMRTCSCN